MPRSAGIYTPPGTSFPAVPTTLIEAAKYNAVINDIATALTQSIATNGTSTVTGNISVNNNKVTNLAIGTTSGDAIRNSQIARGTDINITASGVQAVPSDGGNFVMTAAASFNITGFSSTTFTGRMFSIKFPTNFTQNLVNSATFKLRDGSSRTTVKGETAFFILQSIGPPVFEEIANQSVLDLTGYTGADLSLGVGQVSTYTLTAVSSIALRAACLTNQIYELDIILDQTAGANNATLTSLLVNNAALGAADIQYQTSFGSSASPIASTTTTTVYGLDTGNIAYRIKASISTRTQSKGCFSEFFSLAAVGVPSSGRINSAWINTVTAHTSLGTINFNRSVNGTVTLRRVL